MDRTGVLIKGNGHGGGAVAAGRDGRTCSETANGFGVRGFDDGGVADGDPTA